MYQKDSQDNSFVVQYDVERGPQGGEVLVQDGYFVQFFAPSELKPLNKFIIFVLDTSASMAGQKLYQLKQAMLAILEQLTPNDYFHIIEFNTHPRIWSVIHPDVECDDDGNNCVFICTTFPSAVPGTSDNIEKAKKVVLNLNAQGNTNVNKALQEALETISREGKIIKGHAYLPQPMIMFLSDGYATEGVIDQDEIITKISIQFTNGNEEQAPIYTLSFGGHADENLLKKLSLKNQGFSRHIYEASDAALQLQDFYRAIASPLLNHVKFEYVPGTIVSTRTMFPFHFEGSEIVVAGKLNTPLFPKLPQVSCTSSNGPVTFQPAFETPVTSLKRLWAYLTIRQLLDEKEIAQDKEANERQALDLALKYSFVTPVSSLVVVKPNSVESTIEIEPADKNVGYRRPPPVSAGSPPDTRFSLSIRQMLPVTSDINDSLIKIDKDDHFLSSPDRTNKLNNLKSALPWLENCLHANGTLKSPPGGYELGLDRTFFYKQSCSETPTNTTGHCELLHECPQVHHLLTTEETYLRYFCYFKKRYGKFAGVCCP